MKPYHETKLGKLYHGDCLDILPQLDNESIDLIITSPPYNKNSANRSIGINDTWKRANISYESFKDDVPENIYQQQQKELVKLCLDKLKSSGSFFYNHKNRIKNHRIISPEQWLSDFIIRQVIVWNRKNSPVLEPIRFMPITELIYWITKEAKTPFFNKEGFIYKDVWEISPTQDKDHPASFPKEIPNRCIRATTQENFLVLDYYMGSGTTALACEDLKRRWIGIEKEEKYCELASKRIDEFTKQGVLF
jgi:site-specific DNA-methyltransferase (adenine-specific)